MKSLTKNLNIFKFPILFSILLILTLVIGGFEVRNSLYSYINEFEPLELALDDKRSDLYTDSVLLYRFVYAQNTSELIKIEGEIISSDHKCLIVNAKIQAINENGLLRDELYESYKQTLVEHQRAEEIKDELIALHKENLILNSSMMSGGEYVYFDKLSEYQNHFQKALNNIENELMNIELQKEELRLEVVVVEWVVVILSLIFLVLTIITFLQSFEKLNKNIVEPFEEIDKNLKEFVEGDFKSQLKLDTNKEEILELQKRINTLFSYVDGVTTNDPNLKKDFKEQFLKSEYVEIIEYLKSRKNHSLATTMKDLKLHLRITHPTLISRLKYLEDNFYISIEKEGRDKLISLV